MLGHERTTRAEEQVAEAVEAKLKEKPLAKVAEAVGLKIDAKEPEILEAIRAKGKPPEKEKEMIACKEVLDALDLKEGSDKSEVVATIHALKQGKDLPGRVAALEKEIATDRREALVAKAMAEGKIAPAQKEWAEAYAEKDPKGFDDLHRQSPAGRARGQGSREKGFARRRRRDSPKSRPRSTGLCGVSAETWKKHNPAPATQ